MRKVCNYGEAKSGERGSSDSFTQCFLKPVLMFLATTVAIWPTFRLRNAKDDE